MAQIKAADVAKLRKMTGSGMMDCKKALEESNGDFDKAIEYLRKKGQKVASKRADREATEGAVIAKTGEDGKVGALIVLNCETDFVAKNDDFVKFAHAIADIAINQKPTSLDELKKLSFNEDKTIQDEVTNQTGVIGEKIDLSHFSLIEAPRVICYIHTGNKLAAMAGFNHDDVDPQVGKDVVMQIAAMNPVAIDKDDVSEGVINKEIEIGKDQAIQEGKPADLAEKIARGRLNKFFKENTLLNQDFVKNNKQSIRDYLKAADPGLKVTAFKRFALEN